MLANIPKEVKPELWQQLLNQGNKCFKDKNLLQAEYYYKEAESHLDYLWSIESTNVNLLMAWICSLHNLASLFEQQGNNQIGLQYLLIPHHRMMKLSQNKETSEDIKLIAINALKLTFTPILLFTKRNPICEDCEQGLKDFQHNLESYDEVVH